MGLDTKDKKRLRVQLVDNPLKNDGEEKVFKLITSGTADLNRIINEIMSYNPGFEREMVEAVLKLEQRAVLNLTLNGMRVNNGLFSAVASPKGRGSATWNRDINRLDIRLTQGALWRDSVRNTSVSVLGLKSDSMYIGNVKDLDNGLSFVAGNFVVVTGRYLKLVGDDESIGIYFVSAEGERVKVDDKHIAVNMPRRLVFLIPEGLPAGEYMLEVVSQYTTGFRMLQQPRTASMNIVISQSE